MFPIDLLRIGTRAQAVISELIEVTKLPKGSLVVIGCSTSEVQGERIGTSSSVEVAECLYASFSSVASGYGVSLAFQCCEHLNRALVLEREVATALALDPVRVVPVPKAGGAMAATAFMHLSDPVVVESINAKALAGLDIGSTLIGMHIHPVVVPLRLKYKAMGRARLTAAYSRAKLIGGSRAVYE